MPGPDDHLYDIVLVQMASFPTYYAILFWLLSISSILDMASENEVTLSGDARLHELYAKALGHPCPHNADVALMVT